jgi:hypothetical protein
VTLSLGGQSRELDTENHLDLGSPSRPAGGMVRQRNCLNDEDAKGDARHSTDPEQ